MKRLYPISIAFFVLLLVLDSCKKDSSNISACRISNANYVSHLYTQNMAINYNAEGKMDSVIITGYYPRVRTFSYNENSISRVDIDESGRIMEKHEIMLNSKGKITTIYHKNGIDSLKYSYSFTYHDDGNLRSMDVKNHNDGSTSMQYLNYSEGNFKTTTSGNSILTLDYYEDKQFLEGDYYKFQQIINYGALYISNKNLFKSIHHSDGAIADTAIYEYDGSGKILKLVFTDGFHPETTIYSYECF